MDAQSFYSPTSSPGLQVPYNSPTNSFQYSERVQTNVLSRALEANSTITNQHMNTNGFVRPEQLAARRRRCAGLPLLRPNRLRNNSQSQMDEMNTACFPDQAQSYSQDNVSNFRNALGEQPSYGLRHDFDQQRHFSQQPDSHHQVNYIAQNDYSQDATGADEHAYLQQRLYSLAEAISNQQGLSTQVVAGLTAELQELSQRHMGLRRTLQTEHRLAQAERERLANNIASQQRLIQNALAERDRACEERDRLQAQSTAVHSRQWELERRLEELEKKNTANIDFLRKQIRFKDEQLNGKRSLWMKNQNHRNSGANHVLGTPNSFSSPNTQQSPRTRQGFPLADNSEEMQSTTGPSKTSRKPTTNPTCSPEPEFTNHFLPYRNENDVNSPSLAEDGHSPVGVSKALIPFKTEDQIAQEFREDFDSVYRLIENWVENYAHIVNDDMTNDQDLSHDEDLWPFMLSCTYSNFANAHEHTILLLRNPATRSSFVKRLIIQYLYTSIWKATAFGAFNPKYKEKLEMMDVQMKVKGLEPVQRANLVAAQTHCVQCVIENKMYLAFRSQALSGHAKALRGKVGPLLDEGVIRADAGKALGVIVVGAWDLSAKLYTSNYTFLFNFPVCGSRFLHPTMECDDPNVEETDLQLHIRQAKIKLAIKPIITMRNDRHMTISVKKVQNAHVLIFP